MSPLHASVLPGFVIEMIHNPLALLVFSFLYICVDAWGRDGHFITARLANSLLDKRGRNLLSDLLADGVTPMEDIFCNASVWADHVSDSRQYKWSKSLHYINIPDGVCDGFKFDRECAANCTVSAIVRFAQIVEDVTSTRSNRIDSLRFLIHLIADLHQPLHVSFGRDKGGSTLKIVPPTSLKRDRHGHPISNISLHSAWDTDIIHYLLNKRSIDWKQLADEMSAKASFTSSSLTDNDELNSLISIANNSATITCTTGYVHETGIWITAGDHLSTDYYDRASNIVYDQLSKAGIHIASVLNSIGHTLYDDAGTDVSDDSGFESSDSSVEP